MLKKYDGLFIFSNTTKDDALAGILEAIEAEMRKLGAEVEDRRHLGLRAFARPMHKQESGHYVRIRFQADPSKIGPLQGRLRLMEDVFRAQIVVAEPRTETKPEAAPAPMPVATEENDHGKL